jgi:hypothetical protein
MRKKRYVRAIITGALCLVFAGSLAGCVLAFGIFGITGDWDLNASWEGGGHEAEVLCFENDHSFSTDSGTSGTWAMTGDAITFSFTHGGSGTYEGMLSSDKRTMSGTMTGPSSTTGTWTAHR